MTRFAKTEKKGEWGCKKSKECLLLHPAEAGTGGCYKGESGSESLRFGNEGFAEGNTRKGREGGEVGSCAFFVFWRCPPNVRCGRQEREWPSGFIAARHFSNSGGTFVYVLVVLFHLLWRRATKEVRSSHSEVCHLQATSQSPHAGKLPTTTSSLTSS
jgi:hypothetical protein